MRQSDTRLYTIWKLMKARCSNKNNVRYHNYGGRGIKVCDEWQEFIPFMNWAITHGYTDELTLDRINNDGNYEPSNCRWATNMEQQNNKKNTLYISIGEVTDTITGWCNRTGLKRSTLRCRFYELGLRGKDLISPIVGRWNHGK